MVFQIEMKNMGLTSFQFKRGIITSISAVIIACASSLSIATPPQQIPDLAKTPLELTPTVFANVMILLDDSGSKDFEVITADALSSGLFFGPDPDGSNFGSSDPSLQITQRPGCELEAAAFGGYAYGISTTSNVYQNNCYVADERSWRFRCAAFNKLYYNPDVVYEPWKGFRDDGTEFADVPVDDAPLDPYLANSSTIDFTQAPEASTGIDKFRYYTCSRKEDGNFTMDSEVDVEPDSPELQNFANWFSYHRSRHLRVKAILGEYIFNENNARVGLAHFSNANNIVAKELNIDATEAEKSNLLSALYSSSPQAIPSNVGEESPLADRYKETRDYLACRNSDLFPGISPSDPGSDDCPAESIPAGTCQANHIILTSDGFYDRIFINPPSDRDSDDSSEFDGPPFEDNIPDTLADLAISFYEDDLHSDLPDEVVPEPIDINFADLDSDDRLHQHIKTHIVTLQPALRESLSEAPPWNNPRNSDLDLVRDFVHAAFNARGKYIDAAEQAVGTSAANLSQAISTGLGSTTPIAINTQATSADLILYRTFYDSFSNSGDLVAQEVSINSDGTLNVSDGSQPTFLWSASKQLDLLAGVNGASNLQRTIFTFSNDINDGIEFDFDELDSSQQSDLNNPEPARATPLPIGKDRLEYLRGLTTREGTSFIDGEFRIRPETDSTGGGIIHNAKLGTIANAAPVFVGQPQAVGRFGGAWPSIEGETYFDFQAQQVSRDASVLVAANDGMFHVFNAQTGNERFAYVPSFVFENLSELTRPEYKHQYFVDSTPSVEDAYIRAGGTSPSWNTIVVGGLGAGGRGYYALNITEPGPEENPVNQVMWEFGPEDDPDANSDGSISDLGFSYGRPLIAMSNAPDGVNKRWVAVFGNGYNSTSEEGEAIIYMLFIDEGIDGVWSKTPNSDLVKINTGVEGDGKPNGIADVRAIDLNADGTIDRLYAGDLRGNLHVINIISEDPGDWSSSSNRFILLKAVAPNSGESNSGDPQPITTRPIVVQRENGAGVVVVVTTGSYFTESDAIDTGIQSIYGVFDEVAFDQAGNITNAIGSEVSISNLREQFLSNNVFVDATAGINLEVRTVTNNAIGSRQGWFIDFDVEDESGDIIFPGEKAIRELQLRNGVLFVNTIIPQPLSCDPSPGGFSLALNPQNGTAGQEVIFDINADNLFDSNDNINVAGQLKTIVGTRFKSTPSDSTFFGDYRITQLADTDIDSILTNTAKTELVGRQAWREVEF
ncbi:MAG: PilC/PilY family type IV pilus protein [Gammaproteobacteria bacterium]|nr:PilC/PilY family type IV pilus protein [Gammaproteobacteria bacterium]